MKFLSWPGVGKVVWDFAALVPQKKVSWCEAQKIHEWGVPKNIFCPVKKLNVDYVEKNTGNFPPTPLPSHLVSQESGALGEE